MSSTCTKPQRGDAQSPFLNSRILVAISDPAIRDFAHASLLRFGLSRIVMAENGLAAFSYLLDGLARSRRCPFELVIAQEWMPGMDGIQLVRSVKQHRIFRWMSVLVIQTKNREGVFPCPSPVRLFSASEAGALMFSDFVREVFAALQETRDWREENSVH